MKIKSLLLGSVAALGLASGASAADPVQMLALGLCDGFGVWSPSKPNYEGDTHCVRVDGGASIAFSWGNYKGATAYGGVFNYNASTHTVAAPDGAAGTELDWESEVTGWMRWVGIANASTGPVSAVIKFKETQEYVTQNEAFIGGKVFPAIGAIPGTGPDHTNGVVIDEAYGQALIGSSVWMAGGKKGSIRNIGDDTPLTVVNLFNSAKVDSGVFWSAGTRAAIGSGGHVFQASVDAGNGITLLAGLENLQATGAAAGALYGVLAYTGGNFTGHATVAAGGILDGTIEAVAAHLGGTLTLDMATIRAALAVDSTAGVFSYNGLLTGSLVVEDITFALAGEIASFGGAAVEYGAGASVSYAASSAITLQLAGRFYDPDSTVANDEVWHGLGKVIWAATDTLTLTLEGGAHGAFSGAPAAVFYGTGTLAFDAGGGFTASASATGYSNGAFKGTLKVADDII